MALRRGSFLTPAQRQHIEVLTSGSSGEDEASAAIAELNLSPVQE
jgi:hypothetical protein